MAKKLAEIKKLIEEFFTGVEGIWSVTPGYFKAFLYSFSSSVFGLWIANQLDLKAVAIIVASNLGLYSAPRIIGSQTRKLLDIKEEK